jgi:hypothetical protein
MLPHLLGGNANVKGGGHTELRGARMPFDGIRYAAASVGTNRIRLSSRRYEEGTTAVPGPGNQLDQLSAREVRYRLQRAQAQATESNVAGLQCPEQSGLQRHGDFEGQVVRLQAWPHR